VKVDSERINDPVDSEQELGAEHPVAMDAVGVLGEEQRVVVELLRVRRLGIRP
jgi:hypothetical protein